MLKFHSNIIFSKNIFSLKDSIFWGKVFAISLFYLICSNSPASAKTAGNYLGVDLVTSKITVQNIQYFIDQTKVHRYTNPTSARSYGISYNYAFNYKNFFIAPVLYLKIIESLIISIDNQITIILFIILALVTLILENAMVSNLI